MIRIVPASSGFVTLNRYTSSRWITEVKQRRAWIVLVWVTICVLVLYVLLAFPGSTQAGKMDFNTDITAAFKQYTVAFKKLKQDNTMLRNRLQMLDKETEATEKLLQTFNQQDCNKVDSLLDQMEKELEKAKELSRQLEEELRSSEKKFTDLIQEIEEDKKLHELEKAKIAIGMKTEVKNLIQEVEDLRNQLQTSATENTNLQVDLISAENEYTRFQKDMEKLTESCSSLDLAKVELESKISAYKETSNEELLRVERNQRLRIEDLNRTGQKLEAQLNNLNKNKKIGK